MKVENKKLMIAVALFVAGGSMMNANPETAELIEPKAIRVVEPVIPYDLGRSGVPGEVKVTFQIDDNGRPHDIEVESYSHYEYAQSVEKAIRDWRYEVPEKTGVKYRLPVLFN